MFRLQANLIFLKSNLFRQTVHIINWKWSNTICVSRHNQPICMGCFGNDIRTYVTRLSKRIQKNGGTSSCSPNKHPVESRCRTPPPLLSFSCVTEETGIYCDVLCWSHVQNLWTDFEYCINTSGISVTGFDVIAVCRVKTSIYHILFIMSWFI